jgi:3-hydroxyisobutyrate dehydrogenase-like beta-hydroxyacid dehydrogenase
MHKDLQMVSESAYDSTRAMPPSATALGSYRLALQSGPGKADFAAIYHWLHG